MMDINSTKMQDSEAISISLYDNSYAIENLEELIKSLKNISKNKEMEKNT